MGTKVVTFQVPFFPDGSIPHYPQTRPWVPSEATMEWRDPAPFNATLVLLGMCRGRSAANFTFRNKATGAVYTVFMKDLLLMVQDARWVQGSITGDFEPCKRGANYGVRLCKAK